MGVTSLILGIISLCLAIIPGCGIFLAEIPILLGIIFGIIGIVLNKDVKAIIGLILSGLAILIGFFSIIFWIIIAEVETETDFIETPPIESADYTYEIGDYVRLDDRMICVTKVEELEGTEEIKPKEGKEFVTVHITIQNMSDDIISYSPYYFKIKNEDKQLKSVSYISPNEATDLETGELLPGGKVSGTLTFEQDKDDKKLTLICYEELWDEWDYKEIDLKFTI